MVRTPQEENSILNVLQILLQWLSMESIFVKFIEIFLFKARLKTIVCKTVSGSVRSECYSCRMCKCVNTIQLLCYCVVDLYSVLML